MEAKSWRPNAFVFKILTSKIFDIKILQTLFAKPAPSKTFREYGGGGVPRFRIQFPNPQQPPVDLFREEIHSLCSPLSLPLDLNLHGRKPRQ